MKQYFALAAFFIPIAICFSCTQQFKKIEDEYGNGTSLAINKNLRVELKGKVVATRSYDSIQKIQSEKDRKAYMAKQEKTNPKIYETVPNQDSIIINQFIAIGLIKGSELIIDNFKSQANDTGGLIMQSGEKMELKFYGDDLNGDIWVNIFFKNDSLRIYIDRIKLQKLQYAFIDVIKGGNKELVVLENSYIRFGDRFELFVYEIRVK